MSLTSALFYNSNNSNEQSLYRRISPTGEQFDEQIARKDELQDYLKGDLKEQAGYSTASWLQGSYKFGTQIRPVRSTEEYDIDLGIYFEWAGNSSAGSYSPKQLKNMVQASLKKYQSLNPDDVIEVIEPGKARCCRIRFKGDFHIDIPCYHLDLRKDLRALATENNDWETSDPKALYVWFKDSFNDGRRAKARRMIQYVKTWAALKFPDLETRPSSVLITVLVAEAMVKLTDEQIAADDDALLVVLEKIVSRLEANATVNNPVNKNECISSRLSATHFNSFFVKLKNFRDIASLALRNDNKIFAAIKWSEAFDHLFPMPEEEKTDGMSKALVPYRVYPAVKVNAISNDNVNIRYEGDNKIGPIPLNCRITFEIINGKTIPADAEVNWVVRNEGSEAEYVNDLGHLAGMGLSASERSAYKGIHYMDCIVKLYGQIIGFKRVPVQIQGVPVPRRNPVKRPSYRTFAVKR